MDGASMNQTGQTPAIRRITRTSPPISLYQSKGKRLFDVIVATTLLILSAPILILIALAIRWYLGPGIIFTQRRVGRNGNDFTMYKFRTMKDSRRQEEPKPFNGSDRRESHKRQDDPRHTPLGRALRRSSLDELPQLFNVVRGEMSLVGPRPELSEVADHFGFRRHARHQISPGLTGEWQIGTRSNGQLLRDAIDEDLAYLERITFMNDLTILVKTVGAVIKGGGQ